MNKHLYRLITFLTSALNDKQMSLQFDNHSHVLYQISALVTLGSQLLILAINYLYRPTPSVFLISLLLLMIICAFAAFLEYRITTLGTGMLVILITIWSLGVYATSKADIVLFILPFISVFTLLLQRPAFSMGLNTIMALFVLLFTDISIGFAVLAAIWFCWGIGWIIRNSWMQIFTTALEYQAYAAKQMAEAREHRAQLMQLTKALKESQENLDYANTQLRHAHYAAEEARLLKARFAANVSHEFRTPINLIVGFTEVMVKSPQVYGQPLPGAYWGDLHTIYENAHHLQSLINDVLDISQMEAGYMTVVREVTDVRKIILEAGQLVCDSIKNSGLEFTLEVPETLPPAQLDRVRIRQVLLNLLGNAIRFTSQGGITLRANADEEYIRIEVVDTGAGIQSQDLPHVFDEFFQAAMVEPHRKQGAGLGLTLSKRFIDLHNGQLTVTSEGMEGKGSCFTILLPTENAETRQRALTLQSAVKEAGSRNFIVMDDDPAIQLLFERYSLKHHPIKAETHEEAAHLLQTTHPTALILDCEYDPAILKTILTVADPSLSIIQVPLPSGRRTLRKLGLADYLVKPVSREMLTAAVAQCGKEAHRILIIDDDADIVRLFALILGTLPFVDEIWQAYGGLEGLEIMKQQRPDVVILDLLMPDLDGFSILEAVKADPDLCDLPLILVSAQGAGDAIRSSVNGAISFSKPAGFQPIELVRCIEALVDTVNPTTASQAP